MRHTKKLGLAIVLAVVACGGSRNADDSATNQPEALTQNCQPVSYNFAAGDEAACEASITSRLGRRVKCAIGAGCTLQGDVPSSPYASANPTLWGACVRGPNPDPACDHVKAYNFVASTKEECERSIVNRLGISDVCSIGGGCTLTGDVPTTGDVSANPSLWGACIFAP